MSDSQEISLVSFAMKYGAVGGAVAIVTTLGFFVAGMQDSQIPQLMGYATMLGIIVWGQIEYRALEPGAVFYSEVLLLGIVIIAYFAIIQMVYTMIHWTFIDPGITERILGAAEAQLRAIGMPDGDVQQAISVQKMLVGPISSPLISGIVTTILGTLISLLTATFTRRRAT